MYSATGDVASFGDLDFNMSAGLRSGWLPVERGRVRIFDSSTVV